MRVTKIKKFKHFKGETEGRLIKNNNYNANYLNHVFKMRKEAMEKSLSNQLTNKKANNGMYKYICSFVNFLISDNKEWDEFENYKKYHSKSKYEISDSLKNKGKKEPYSIDKLLEKASICNNQEELSKTCSDVRKIIKSRLNDKTTCLKRSIRNNYLFSVDKYNKINYNSKRSEFLGKWMEKIFEEQNYGIFIEELEKLEQEKFKIDDLFKKFNEKNRKQKN